MLMSSKNVRKVVKIFTNLKNLVISKNIHEIRKNVNKLEICSQKMKKKNNKTKIKRSIRGKT